MVLYKFKWVLLMFVCLLLGKNYKNCIFYIWLKGIWEIEFIIKRKWVICKDLF